MPRRATPSATLLPDGKVLVAGVDAADNRNRQVYDPATGTWTAAGAMARPGIAYGRRRCWRMAGCWWPATRSIGLQPSCTTRTPGRGPPPGHAPAAWNPVHVAARGTVLVAGGQDCLNGECVAKSFGGAVRPGRRVAAPVASLADTTSASHPNPDPEANPLPPEAGPVPSGARPWTVTVVNQSSQPATLFVAEKDTNGITRLCGSVTPNVVPAGTTVEVSSSFPAKGVEGCWLIVNPVPGDEGGFFETSDAPTPGKVWLRADGEIGWLGP